MCSASLLKPNERLGEFHKVGKVMDGGINGLVT